MYHFKPTEHALETTILNEHTELSGRAIKFLKDFQIHAVRVLFEQYCKQDFCILNDESGLGKSASVAVFLGIVAVRKKCLVVVSNSEECITGWRFHLDILTDLKVSVLNTERDYDATDYRVYIANWNTLRAMGDLSKFNFDLVVVDNREHILNNSFCISTLLKNVENKVQVVISSVDITSDVKLLHNVLRLGGRLDHQLENFKTFEQKYKLPDLKAISSKKSDLEDYFLKREILNDYCRSFRLRRYRHQFENVLPLVDPERYKAFLNEWRHATKEKITKTALLIGAQLPYEIGTEELLEQYQTNPDSFRVESVPALPSSRENLDDAALTLTEGMQNTLAPPAALDITDDLMEMPPLVFVTDSDDQDEEEDVIFLSSESAEQAAAAIPVIEIEEEEDETPEKLAAVNVKAEKLSPRKKLETVKEVCTPETPMTTRQKNKRKTTTPSKKIDRGSPVGNYTTTPRTRSNKQSAISTRKSVGKSGDKIAADKAKKTTHVAKIRKEIKQPNKTPPQKEKTTEALQIKPEKMTPKKHETTPNKAASAKSIALQAESSQKKKDIEKKSKTPSEHKNEVRAKKSKEDAPKTPTERRRSQKMLSTPMIGVPLRETRNMQRNTRSSGGKRKCFALEFDDNKKTKVQTKQKATASAEKMKNTRKAGKITNAETVPLKKADSAKNKQLTKTERKSSTPKDLKVAKKSTADQDSKNTKKAKDATTKPENSTQSSVIPMSSEYEEIQCGQKLYSSNDSSPKLLEKPNEFLKPFTPPPFRVSRLASSDSDVALLLPSSSSQKRKNAADAVIVLSSSQDEASFSSQASTAEQGRSARSSTTPTGTQKRKRFSKRISLPSSAAKEPLTFGDLLAKQRERAKSPDLFSVGSDAGVLTQGSSNILPFTQPNGKPSSGLTTTTSPIFGFKIFGSEVRSFQQSMAIEANSGNSDQTTKRRMRGKRSCLNILEQMFEKNPDTNSVKNGKAKESKEQRKLRHATSVQTSVSKSVRKQVPNTAYDSSQISQPVTARKPINDNQQKATGESEDIFEITNNATFGSTLRISASGHISPVATANNSSNQHHSNNHNKITNYLIGNGSGNEQLLKTPNKRSQQQQQEPGSAGSGVGGTSTVVSTTQTTRKSPKSAKSTQTTKLTKWFRRSSVDESNSNKTAQKYGNSDDRDESAKSAKLVKRRRLDLSLKS